MEMKINAKKIIAERQVRAWSQQHLADVSTVSLRTIQRVENNGTGSLETVKALASCFELNVANLFVPEVNTIKSKPKACKSSSKSKPKIAVLCSLIMALLGSFFFITPSSVASSIMIKADNIKTNTSEDYRIYSNNVEIFLPKGITYEALIDSNWQSNNSSLSSGSVKIYLEHSIVLIKNALISKKDNGTKITTHYAKFTNI